MTLEQKWLKWKNQNFVGFITEDFNSCVDKGVFTDHLKHAGVTTVHKKKDQSDKTNYRSVKYTSKYFQKYL